MRLSILDHGHRRRAKLFLAVTGGPDIVRTLLYRPSFLTRPLLAITVPAMRGPSFWSAAEREYFAMSTAELLQCPFCIETHAELTRVASGGAVDPADPASFRPEVVAMRDFLRTQKLTRPPGLPPDAVIEALRVDLVFNIIARLANAFGFVLREGELRSGTRALHRFGYRFPGFLLADGPSVRHDGTAETLRTWVLEAPAVTGPALRTAAVTGEGLPTEWSDYGGKVRNTSYAIDDDDVGRLRAAGHSEDEIFEVTVAAAVGAATSRFRDGCRTSRSLDP
ncbi:carboxymuconolactone decarboxylase family protein [Mycolicibacterium bacteremicum]|uniref:Carboxymuconolactone decarboxylase-like domain-containing protein n=1 Tax=Mycolicibacterium bacteremicum TaxID=564198 RepID=A0A1W9YUG0_MYCBA|nr:hypothetical protein [Mycolicibacterium bacteremicum]MCV7434143.1 hypothetical protein [Mycolicibacterium bacteremicum]ORA03684.1 hypothetical protein BST17_17580 [Mycolicibacterium bacteremicum]